MTASSRKSCVVFCVVLSLLLSSADLTAAAAPTGVVASTEAFYLRGTPILKAETATKEVDESFESFERRELADDGYQDSSANCSANCDVATP